MRVLTISLLLSTVVATAVATAAQPAYVWPDYSVHRTAYHGQMDRRMLGGNRMHSDTPRAAAGARASSKKMLAVASEPAMAPVAVAASMPLVIPLAKAEIVASRSGLPDLPPPQELSVEQRWQLYSYP